MSCMLFPETITDISFELQRNCFKVILPLSGLSLELIIDVKFGCSLIKMRRTLPHLSWPLMS